jgi:transcriptional regulator with XRE-family HTH domain
MTPDDVRAYRLRHNLTQTQLAEFLGLHRLTIARYEGGQIVVPLTSYLLMRALESGPILNRAADHLRKPLDARSGPRSPSKSADANTHRRRSPPLARRARVRTP